MFSGQIAQLIPLTPSSACYAAGYLVGVGMFLWMARRRKIVTTGIIVLMTVGMIGGLVFANIGQLVFAREAGKSILAGIAGGYLCVIVAKKRMGIVRPTGDLFAVALSAGEMVGRWGCYFGGCCGGKLTHVPWAIYQDHGYRHPTQLYLSATSGIILLILLAADRKRLPENSLFYIQGFLACSARFIVEFFREAPPVALGLTTAQIACSVGIAFFAWKLYPLVYRLAERSSESQHVTISSPAVAYSLPTRDRQS